MALLLGGVGAAPGAEVEIAGPPPELLTNLFQLRSCAAQNPLTIHPFRVVADVLDVDVTRGVLALRDSSGVEFVRVDLGARDIAPGDSVVLEGRGCGVKPERFGLAIAPGLVVDNDGIHPVAAESGRVFLSSGTNRIRLEWFQWFGELGLNLDYEGPGIPRQRIPSSVLSRTQIAATTGRTNWLPGLDYRYYEGTWELLPDLQKLQPVKIGVAKDFDAKVRSREGAFGVEFNGFITIQQAGVYTFHLGSDDGSRLWVGQPFLDVRVLRKGPALPRPVAMPSSGDEANHGSWVTLEGVMTSTGVWDAGGEARLREGSDEIRVDVFESGDFAPVPPRARVQISGIFEEVLTDEGVRVPGRLQVLNWKAVTFLGTELRAALPGGDEKVTMVPAAEESSATNRILTLTTAAEIKALSPELAKQQLPVSIRGVVTAFASKHQGAVVQDSTRGVFVELYGWHGPDPIQRGEYCQIDGVTGPGWFAPVVVAKRITRLGPGELPRPLRATWDQLVNGSLDTEYAEIDGIVTAIQDRRLTLLTAGGKISVELREFRSEALAGFENALIRIRGCFFASFNMDNRKIESGSVTVRSAVVEVLAAAPTDFFDTLPKSIGELLLYDPKAAPFRRLKVSGQVVYSRPGEYFLTDGTNGMHVTTRNQEQLAAGDMVDAVGFLELGGHAAELKDAVLRKTGQAPLPVATKLAPDQLLLARYAGTLVRVEATLINQWGEGAEYMLELQSGFLAFRARVQNRGQPIRLPPFGSRLELTGVYAPQGRAMGAGQVSGFELLLAAPTGIRVLTTPPWWNMKRVFILTGVLAAILGAVLIWNKELYRKVEERGRQLETEIGNRQRAEMQRAAEAERSRIARDLHDDLGTGLTEVSLLASAGLGHYHDEEKIRDRFNNIADKARALVSGLDVIVWAIDPKRNLLQSFADYAGRYARELFAASPIDCRLRIRMESGAVTLSEAARHSLFLAVKEALNNVIRHSAATEVELQILQTGDQLQIVVADNGCGFDPNAVPGGNGLTNFQERLRAMRGECQVESVPGKGTTVRFTVPVPGDVG